MRRAPAHGSWRILEIAQEIARPNRLRREDHRVAIGIFAKRGPLPKALSVRGKQVIPRDVLLALLALQKPAVATGPVDEYEVLRVVVRGTRGGQAVEEISDCHVPGIPAWQLGVDVDTGCPPSIVAQMLLRGDITARGVLPPEKAVPPGPFFEALEQRGMHVSHSS